MFIIIEHGGSRGFLTWPNGRTVLQSLHTICVRVIILELVFLQISHGGVLHQHAFHVVQVVLHVRRRRNACICKRRNESHDEDCQKEGADERHSSEPIPCCLKEEKCS